MSRKKMKLVPSDEIDLRDWTFFNEDDLSGGLRDLLMAGCVAEVTRVLRSEFQETPPSFEFAATFGDRKDEGDLAELLVLLPLGKTADDPVIYSCSLEEAVDFLIEVRTEYEDHDTCTKVAARLRELADKLDAASPAEVAA